MDRMLSPGMRLMRRFPVTVKFAVIAVILVLPLSISMVGAWTDSTDELRFTERERAGLTVIAPLGRLDAQIARLRDDAANGRSPRPGALGALTDVETAIAREGETLGVTVQWTALAAAVQALGRAWADDGPTAGTARRVAACAEAARRSRALFEQVADQSNLILDPELDTYYLVVVLVQEIPDALEAAARAQSLHLLRGAAPASATVLTARQAELDRAVSLIRVHLAKAAAASARSSVGARLAAPAAAFQDAARTLGTRAAAPHPGGWHTEPDLTDLADATEDLSVVVADELDVLFQDRERELVLRRATPSTLALLSLLAAGYLVLAMFRATSSDVAAVLRDILSVNEGGIHSSDPLDGPDEFGRMSRAVVVARDRLTAAMGELSFVARHDELTSMPNRRLALEKLAEFLELDALRRPGGPAGETGPGPATAVAVLRVDGLKDIGDSFGPGLADQVTLVLARRLHRATRRRDVVARVGAQQFAVVLAEVTGTDQVHELLAEVVSGLEQPILVGGRRLHVRIRVGVALSGAQPPAAERMWQDAEVAKATLAATTGPSVAVFTPAMRERHTERVELSADLVQAVEQGELTVYYQPVVDLATRRVHSVEALVRWTHPTRGMIGPDLFIPLAESTGLIDPIGRWVLREAAAQLARWSATYPDASPLRMDVNVSPAQLAGDELLADLLAVLDDTGLAPDRIVLELTETALMADIETATRHLRRFAAVGVGIALDDFGTGYSSLAYLRRLPVDILKIDKAFVREPHPGDGHAVPLLESIVALARALGLETIAEGVETAAQEAVLRRAGCDLGQGFLYGRPMPADEVTALIARDAGTPTVPSQRASGRRAAAGPAPLSAPFSAPP